MTVRMCRLRTWACSVAARKPACGALWGLNPACVCGEGLGPLDAHTVQICAAWCWMAGAPVLVALGSPGASRGALVR